MQIVSLSNSRPFSLPWAIVPDAGPPTPTPQAVPAANGAAGVPLGIQRLGSLQSLLATFAALFKPLLPSPAPVSPARPLPPSDAAPTILKLANQALAHAPDPIVGTFTATSFYLPGHDGVANPNRDMRQVGKLQQFTTDMNALCEAYALTKDARYAEKAAQLLDAWSHAMQPTYGNAYAHYEVYFHLSSVLSSLQALQGYAGWGAERRGQAFNWLHGLATSAMAMRAGGNNIDDWRTLFVGNVAAVTGDRALFQRTISDWQANVGAQIDSDGMLPRELKRTKSLNYSQYALKPMLAFAELARTQGVDLYGTAGGRKLEQGLQAIGPALVDHSLWKVPDIALNHLTPGGSFLLYRLAAARFPNNAAIRQSADALGAQVTAKPGWKSRLVTATLQAGNVVGMPLSVGAAFAG